MRSSWMCLPYRIWRSPLFPRERGCNDHARPGQTDELRLRREWRLHCGREISSGQDNPLMAISDGGRRRGVTSRKIHRRIRLVAHRRRRDHVGHQPALARRACGAPAGSRRPKAEVGVLNEGIIGNRLLKDTPQRPDLPFGASLGQAGLTRFERDVLAQPGVRYVVVGIGINDIAFPGSLTPASEAVSAEQRDLRLSPAHQARPSKGHSSHRHDEPTVRERVPCSLQDCTTPHLLHVREGSRAPEGQRLDTHKRRIRCRGRLR